MERKKLSETQVAAINRPLPAEAVKPHPSKSYLSTIKIPYVTEVLNEVFGHGQWQIRAEVVEALTDSKMVVVKTIFDVEEYGIHYECFGGNDNADRGDAYKGATTDAMTKIASWLGIGAAVFKGKHDIAVAVAEIYAAEDMEQLRALWREHKRLGSAEVEQACAARRRELEGVPAMV